MSAEGLRRLMETGDWSFTMSHPDGECRVSRADILELKRRTDNLDAQIDRLAKFIMAEVPGEPSASEGAVETAIRVIRRLRGVPQATDCACAVPVTPFAGATYSKCVHCGGEVRLK